MMRTIFTSEDTKNIIETIFNGNFATYKASSGSVPYENPNSEEIAVLDANLGLKSTYDLAQYLNINFYSWRQRVVESGNEPISNSANLSTFESWVESLNYSMNESYGLVEKIDEEVTASQDIDSSIITGKVTFLIQTDKVKNLDYYVTKIRNKYLGVPQDIQNSYSDIVKAYIMIGSLMYDNEPSMTQVGECVICSFNFRISYLNDALNYSDTKVEISLDNEATYNELPITKQTWQLVATENALPMFVRPDLTGMEATALSMVKTLAFYDFKSSPLSMAFNDLFWSSCAISVDGVASTVKDVNIPVFVRVTSNGHTYVFKDMISGMEKVITNSDFNISSITLKGWAKIVQQ